MIWDGKELNTIGDVMSAMSAIYEKGDQAEADRFMAAMREDNPKHADANIGYLTGYMDHETMLGMQRMFRAEHPVLKTY